MSDDVKNIEDLSKKGEWVTVQLKVIKLWDPKSDSISQSGIVADETGEISFVSWKKSNLLELKEGHSYIIENAVVDAWNGKKQINFNSRTKIKTLDREIKNNNSNEIVGTVKSIIPRSGYIERCPECNRVLVNDHCPVHIDVKPNEDMRVKASLDSDSSIFIANGKIAEKLLDLQLDQAKKMDKKDLECLIEVKLVGKKFSFQGRKLNSNFIVEDFKIIEGQDD